MLPRHPHGKSDVGPDWCSDWPQRCAEEWHLGEIRKIRVHLCISITYWLHHFDMLCEWDFSSLWVWLQWVVKIVKIIYFSEIVHNKSIQLQFCQWKSYLSRSTDVLGKKLKQVVLKWCRWSRWSSLTTYILPVNTLLWWFASEFFIYIYLSSFGLPLWYKIFRSNKSKPLN